MDDSAPKSLRDPELAALRRERWLSEPGLGSLRDYVLGLSNRGREVPGFDPDDAGEEARLLFVLEAPGPKANASKGSGLLSPDNNDQTAANVWHARHSAGLTHSALHTNIVPWYLGVATVKPSPVELAEGAVQLRYLLDLLPQLEVVILCGEYARRGWRRFTSELIDGPAPTVIETHHPSAQGLVRGDRRAEFYAAVKRAASVLT